MRGQYFVYPLTGGDGSDTPGYFNTNILFQTDYLSGFTEMNRQQAGSGAETAQASFGVNTTENCLGVIQSNCGTSSSGFAWEWSGSGAYEIFFGSYQLNFGRRCAISALSDGTDRFGTVIGFADSVLNSDQSNGAYFKYTDNENSGNWQAVTATAGTRTTTDTGVAPTAGVFQVFEVKVAADRSAVTYYIDGTLVATITTNIPPSTTTMAFGAGIVKTIGTTSRSIYSDWTMLTGTKATAR